MEKKKQSKKKLSNKSFKMHYLNQFTISLKSYLCRIGIISGSNGMNKFFLDNSTSSLKEPALHLNRRGSKMHLGVQNRSY